MSAGTRMASPDGTAALASVLVTGPVAVLDRAERGNVFRVDGERILRVPFSGAPTTRLMQWPVEHWALRLGIDPAAQILDARVVREGCLVGHHGTAADCSGPRDGSIVYDARTRHDHFLPSELEVDSRPVDVGALADAAAGLVVEPLADWLRHLVAAREENVPANLRRRVAAVAGRIFAGLGDERHWARRRGAWAADAVDIDWQDDVPPHPRRVRVTFTGRELDGAAEAVAIATALRRWLIARWARDFAVTVVEGRTEPVTVGIELAL